jgi:hypothetical protein
VRPSTPRDRVIATAAVVAAGLVVGAIVLDARRPKPGRFDGRLWKLVGPQDDDRLDMADDLIARDRLAGLTRAKVLKLLGEPNGNGRFQPGDLAYRLGLERAYMPVDFEWLVVHFDDQDRVARYWLAVD